MAMGKESAADFIKVFLNHPHVAIADFDIHLEEFESIPDPSGSSILGCMGLNSGTTVPCGVDAHCLRTA